MDDAKRRKKPKSNRMGDPAIDRCQTPAYALDPLLPYLKKKWTVWECAAGERNLVFPLAMKVHEVVASDILSGEDFFSYQPSHWDCIVTNPPYSMKYKWLKRCYELGKPFALLMPVDTVGAKSAQVLFDKYGFEWIFMDKRINFKMPNMGWNGGGAQFSTAWFCWQLTGRPVSFVKITRRDDDQLSMEYGIVSYWS